MARRSKAKKVTSENELNINPFTLDSVQVEELRRKLAKRANQRLVRLERETLETGETLADLRSAQYAYEQIKKVRGEGSNSKRFRESKLPTTTENARQELYALQSFLGSKYSRVSPSKKQIARTRELFSRNGKQIEDYRSYYNFLNSRFFQWAKEEGLDSEQVRDKFIQAWEKGMNFKDIQKTLNEYMTSMESGESADPTIRGIAKALGVSPIYKR